LHARLPTAGRTGINGRSGRDQGRLRIVGGGGNDKIIRVCFVEAAALIGG